MSEQASRLGLGNSISEETDILHTSIIGKRAFGRITDLLLAWSEKHHQIEASDAATVRMLTQAMLEFAYPEGKQDLGFLEFAIENEKRIFSVRFPATGKVNAAAFEKEITQFWMNSERSKALKRNLGPHDRVEVRFHEKLNVIEWRVIHRVGVQEIELAESSFRVFVDSSEGINSFHKKYTDLGDLPFDSLLEEVYKGGGAKQKSGEMFYQGQSLQKEEEVARVTFEKETQDIEDDIRISGEKIPLQDAEKIVFAADLSDTENKEIQKQTDVYVENTIANLKFEQIEAKAQAKEAIRESKKKELEAQRRMIGYHQKVTKLEELLRKKELINARAQYQVKVLNDKVSELQAKASPDGGNAKAFREKALQMHQMLLKVKEENAELEKILHEMKTRKRDHDAQEEADQILARSSSVSQVQLEEISKKADRLHRALETEKAKVKQLSERVMAAEKESMSAGPIIEDLERKVEQALKTSQQHKKDTEAVKLKLVQSQAEKNKIQNELAKSRAEIQTLLKRQA